MAECFNVPLMTGHDHKSFLASFPPHMRAELTQTSDRPALLHLAGHITVLAGLTGWIASGAPLWGVALLPLGVAMAFLFTLQHECIHRTPFRTGWVNEVAGTLIGLVLIQPFEWFRAFHLAHHRFTNDPERDPELESPQPTTRPELLWHLVGVGYWWAKIVVLARNALGQSSDAYVSARQKRRIVWEARSMIAVYAIAIPLAGAWLFWLWLLPLALGFPALRLYLLAEHGRCPPVANMFENTRTTLTNRLVRWVAWNMPFHAEHHAWPQVPYHKLPEVHDHAKAHLRKVSPSYTAFSRDYISALK